LSGQLTDIIGLVDTQTTSINKGCEKVAYIMLLTLVYTSKYEISMLISRSIKKR